jgi:ribose transport system substrate-binding protein
VKAAHLSPVHDVVTIGFNGDPDAVTAIKAGGMSATVAQDPTAMGALTVKLATEALKGQTPDWNNTEDREVYAPVTLIAPKNAAQFGG